MNFTYETWDNYNTQFLKQVLGCAFQTSNNMVRADVGSRPLITTLKDTSLSLKVYKPEIQHCVTMP